MSPEPPTHLGYLADPGSGRVQGPRSVLYTCWDRLIPTFCARIWDPATLGQLPPGSLAPPLPWPGESLGQESSPQHSANKGHSGITSRQAGSDQKERTTPLC